MSPPKSSSLPSKFPHTRYQGSKYKLIDWLTTHLINLDFNTCLDAFGGTGVVAHRLKQLGKQVTYNDVLRFNHQIGKALIENNATQLSQETINWILASHENITYPNLIQQTFEDIYFTTTENTWIDGVITNIRHLDDSYQQALAFFALSQACIIKRPYNLFHRKNLYMRTAKVERSFGNKSTWDRPFEEWFKVFTEQANHAVFDNGHTNRATNQNILTHKGIYDLVYIDPPYLSSKGVAVDYRDFYHFLEGLTFYDEWGSCIDYSSKHRRLQKQPSIWHHKRTIYQAFNQLFERFSDSILLVSYRDDGIPTINELVDLLKHYKATMTIHAYGNYQYALSTNRKSKEVLLIAK